MSSCLRLARLLSGRLVLMKIHKLWEQTRMLFCVGSRDIYPRRMLHIVWCGKVTTWLRVVLTMRRVMYSFVLMHSKPQAITRLASLPLMRCLRSALEHTMISC